MPTAVLAQPTRHVRLVMVTQANNNKFYEMKENGDGTFTAEYGRIGASPSARSYPIQSWDTKYREKLRKGYTDISHLFAEEPTDIEFDIDDATIRRLMNRLNRYANQSIFANYMVSADQVTRQQIDEAQTILNALVGLAQVKTPVDHFNQRLLALYTVIPRRMPNVKDHLVTSLATTKKRKQVAERLAEEQATLDVMAGQVKLKEKAPTRNANAHRPSLLDAMGLTITPVTDEATVEVIRQAMGDDASRFRRAYAVTNLRTHQTFDTFVKRRANKQTTLLWHGSRNENWLSILESGLVLRPANAIITGKMFGYGLYFADKCCKSLNYTSLRGSYWSRGRDTSGYLALFDVHLGHQLHVKKYHFWCSTLNAKTLKLRSLFAGQKYDSLFAEGGSALFNNEYIVYHETQCTIRYLVEVGA